MNDLIPDLNLDRPVFSLHQRTFAFRDLQTMEMFTELVRALNDRRASTAIVAKYSRRIIELLRQVMYFTTYPGPDNMEQIIKLREDIYILQMDVMKETGYNIFRD